MLTQKGIFAMKMNVVATLMVVGIISMGSAYAQRGGARAIDPALRATPAEMGVIRALQARAANVPALRGVVEGLQAKNAAGSLHATTASAALAAAAALASPAARAALPTEAEVAAEMAKLDQNSIVMTAPAQEQATDALSFMQQISEDPANCELAMGKAPVSTSLPADQQIVIVEAQEAATEFFNTLQFYGLNNQQVAQNIKDLVNSGPEGQVDVDVAQGLGAVFSNALPAVTVQIAALAKDGLSKEDLEKVETCTVFWGVSELAAQKGLPSSDGAQLAQDVGGACSLELTGKQMTGAALASTCSL